MKTTYQRYSVKKDNDIKFNSQFCCCCFPLQSSFKIYVSSEVLNQQLQNNAFPKLFNTVQHFPDRVNFILFVPTELLLMSFEMYTINSLCCSLLSLGKYAYIAVVDIIFVPLSLLHYILSESVVTWTHNNNIPN